MNLSSDKILEIRERVLADKIKYELDNTPAIDVLDKIDKYIESSKIKIIKNVSVSETSHGSRYMFCEVVWVSSITGKVFDFDSYFIDEI